MSHAAWGHEDLRSFVRAHYAVVTYHGVVLVLRDGRVYDVNWQRRRATDGTQFTTKDGRPVDFAKGQVWVVLTKAPG